VSTRDDTEVELKPQVGAYIFGQPIDITKHISAHTNKLRKYITVDIGDITIKVTGEAQWSEIDAAVRAAIQAALAQDEATS
jgi:hypothetical protein